MLVNDNTQVSDNRGDGIKYNFHRREPDRSASETFQDFCSGASNPNQAYPIVTVYNQDRFSLNDLTCSRVSAASGGNLSYSGVWKRMIGFLGARSIRLDCF